MVNIHSPPSVIPHIQRVDFQPQNDVLRIRQYTSEGLEANPNVGSDVIPRPTTSFHQLCITVKLTEWILFQTLLRSANVFFLRVFYGPFLPLRTK